METNKGTEVFYAKTRLQWRRWLEKHSQSKKVVCAVIRHKNSKMKGIGYSDAIEEALCFGWIDSKANKRDPESFYLQFTPRKPKSNWSMPNFERVSRMVNAGLMTEHGQKFIDLAKQSGRWPSANAR